MSRTHIIGCVLAVAGLLMPHASKAQTAEAVLKTAAVKFKSVPEVSANMRYTTYKGPVSPEVMETYSGFYIKKGQAFYFKLKSTEVASFDDYVVKLNNDQKVIQVNKNTGAQQLVDFDAYLKYFKADFVKTQGDVWICKLTPQKLTQQPFAGIVLHIRKKDYTIAKQIMYYAGTVDYNGASIQPRIEADFTPRKTTATDANLLIQKNYFTISKSGITPSARLAKYTLYKD